jgi:hypothetical protein
VRAIVTSLLQSGIISTQATAPDIIHHERLSHMIGKMKESTMLKAVRDSITNFKKGMGEYQIQCPVSQVSSHISVLSTLSGPQ